MNIKEVYARNIATVGKDASVVRAAAIMRQHQVHDLMVIERKYGGWAPAGTISDRDIAIEVVGQGLDPRDVTVGAAMSSKLASTQGGSGDGADHAADTLSMDAMLALLVTELNHRGQPIQQHRLTQPSSV